MIGLTALFSLFMAGMLLGRRGVHRRARAHRRVADAWALRQAFDARLLEPPVFHETHLGAFDGVDAGFYADVDGALAMRGYIDLGWREDAAARAANPDMAHPMQAWVSPAGDIVVTAAHLHLRGWQRLMRQLTFWGPPLPLDVRAVSAVTEVGEHWVVTSNTLGHDAAIGAPDVHVRRMPADTALDVLLDVHAREVDRVCTPGHSVQSVRTPADAERQAERLYVVYRDWYVSEGRLPKAFFDALTPHIDTDTQHHLYSLLSTLWQESPPARRAHDPLERHAMLPAQTPLSGAPGGARET